eukprot:gnl/TRDRNA2_/TRDRNA2_174920_c2_seq4.p1 gnl/TRDRNA2_/TRDRNA2_174920_c2~~gnl/TRDRNA2_/TRDRNA2_174920_c2_seq4.p1  ORF type:complete len:468 (-),score=111.99 gnl/TRDRNA2_/TRDRNA2_174920_c2_seq4:139-1503(-)
MSGKLSAWPRHFSVREAVDQSENELCTEFPVPVRHLHFKTKMCKFEQKGKCRMGKQCKYAHGGEELQPLPLSVQEPKHKLAVQQLKQQGQQQVASQEMQEVQELLQLASQLEQKLAVQPLSKQQAHVQQAQQAQQQVLHEQQAKQAGWLPQPQDSTVEQVASKYEMKKEPMKSEQVAFIYQMKKECINSSVAALPDPVKVIVPSNRGEARRAFAEVEDVPDVLDGIHSAAEAAGPALGKQVEADYCYDRISSADPVKIHLTTIFEHEAFDCAFSETSSNQTTFESSGDEPVVAKECRQRHNAGTEVTTSFPTKRLEKSDTRLFQKYDTDEDKFLNRAEVVNLAKGWYDFVPSPTCLEHIFSCIVRAGCGGVSREDLPLLKKLMRIAKDEALHQKRHQQTSGMDAQQFEQAALCKGIGTHSEDPPPESQKQAEQRETLMLWPHVLPGYAHTVVAF